MTVSQQSDRKLYSLDSAAEVLDVSVHTLRKHVARGAIRTIRVGRRQMLNQHELDKIATRGLPSLAESKK